MWEALGKVWAGALLYMTEMTSETCNGRWWTKLCVWLRHNTHGLFIVCLMHITRYVEIYKKKTRSNFDWQFPEVKGMQLTAICHKKSAQNWVSWSDMNLRDHWKPHANSEWLDVVIEFRVCRQLSLRDLLSNTVRYCSQVRMPACKLTNNIAI